MENKFYNSEFTELLNNEEFIRVVMEAQDADKLLADLVSEYPENSSNIKYAVEFILLTQKDKEQLTRGESELILQNLRIELSKGKSKKIFFRRTAFLKVASVVLVFFTIGALAFYRHFSQDPLKQFANRNDGHKDKSVIVLSDGSEHILDNTELDIDYNAKQGEVLVQSDENLVEVLENNSKKKEESFNQVIVPYGQRQHVILNDGTSVELNAGSKLVFPAAFSGDTRAVYLMGEGYFEVQKDSLHPFIVKTDFIDIKVYGTTFNVAAYRDEKVTSAVLVEGSVSVSKSGKILRNQPLMLSPGEVCLYSIDDQKMDVKNTDVDLYTSWKDGIYKFNDVPLSYIIKKVMQYYNVDVTVEEADILETKLSGKLLIADDIEEVVQYISKALECNYKKAQDGNYSLYK